MGIYHQSKLVTEEQINAERKIIEILEKADMNKDGCYTKSELKKALKDLRSYAPGWRAMRCLTKLDQNHDGKICGDEVDNLIDYLLARGFGKK